MTGRGTSHTAKRFVQLIGLGLERVRDHRRTMIQFAERGLAEVCYPVSVYLQRDIPFSTLVRPYHPDSWGPMSLLCAIFTSVSYFCISI